MALGRIKRDKRKVAVAAQRSTRPLTDARTLSIKVQVSRMTWGRYTALACLGSPPKTKLKMGPQHAVFRARCGLPKYARTPQSAIALAVKSLSRTLAKRGRKFR